MDCIDCTVNIFFFFACLTNQTDHDISLIRCSFEPSLSCVGFVTMRDMHLVVLSQFQEPLFLSKILTLGPDFDH
jgi:hypothetical protein